MTPFSSKSNTIHCMRFGYWEPEANSDAGFAANACSRRQSVIL